MSFTIIVASTLNGIIGNDNDLPWHIPSDLRRFKLKTLNRKIVMGRRKYESLGAPLPNRENYILTRNKLYLSKYTEQYVNDTKLQVISNLSELKDLNNEEIFIIGGAEVYKEALPLCNKIIMTVVQAAKNEIQGNKYFPLLKKTEWELVERDYPSNTHNDQYLTIYNTYVRKSI